MVCAACGTAGRGSRCGGCCAVSYCSIDCQRANWLQHRQHCGGRRKLEPELAIVQYFEEYPGIAVRIYLDNAVDAPQTSIDTERRIVSITVGQGVDLYKVLHAAKQTIQETFFGRK